MIKEIIFLAPSLLYGDVSQLETWLLVTGPFTSVRGGATCSHSLRPPPQCPSIGGQLERMSSLRKTSLLGELVSLRWNGPLRRSCRSRVWGKTCSLHVSGILGLSAVNLSYSKAVVGLFYLIFMSTVATYREVLLPLPRVFLFLRSVLWEC